MPLQSCFQSLLMDRILLCPTTTDGRKSIFELFTILWLTQESRPLCQLRQRISQAQVHFPQKKVSSIARWSDFKPGSLDGEADEVEEGCEFESCPPGSPAAGFNSSDPRLNYVNSFPVTSIAYGISTLSPKFFQGPPDFAVTGPNVGCLSSFAFFCHSCADNS